MKEFKIEIPKGYEIDKEKSTFEKIVFKEVKNMLPKTWEEFGEICCWATPELRVAAEAMKKLSQLKKAYNGDWVADWNDSHHSKWCIIFDGDVIDVMVSFRICRFLAFKDAKTCDLFLENFRDLIEKAKPLMS